MSNEHIRRVHLRPERLADYELFLKIKALPRYWIRGNVAEFPEEYAKHLGMVPKLAADLVPYTPSSFCFDYQADVADMSIRKQKFAVFMGCGWGKTIIFLEYARYVASVLPPDQCVLIVSPLMVVNQTISEANRFYTDLPIHKISAAGLQSWLLSGTDRIGITNYEAIREGLVSGRLGCIILDESSMLKSMYGKWGLRLIDLGKGLNWKLCLTGTPAPNDRIEYANHAVFLDQFPTTNAFLARFFVNRGQTQNRWEMKPHALRPFYRTLSHWCIFVDNPATYGWKDNAGKIPPIHVHIHDVDLTDQQIDLSSKMGGDMFGTPGGIVSRSKLARLAKGSRTVESNKPGFIKGLLDSWPDESTIIWCKFNEEQDDLHRFLPGTASIQGKTKQVDRERIIADFQAGRTKTIISKADVLGLGLNLEVATRQILSTCQDSYEDFIQCIKRSNRVGSVRDLNVHIPITSIERPMVETVLDKAKRVEQDTQEQESIFKEERYV